MALVLLPYMIGKTCRGTTLSALTPCSAIQASSEVLQDGTVADGWEDELTHPVGSAPKGVAVYQGSNPPDGSRSAPKIDGYNIFGDRDYIGCSTEPILDDLLCLWDLGSFIPDLGTPASPNIERRSPDPSSSSALNQTLRELLFPRGPSTGRPNTYPIYQWPMNQGNPTESIAFTTRAYPNGDNGRSVDQANGESREYPGVGAIH